MSNSTDTQPRKPLLQCELTTEGLAESPLVYLNGRFLSVKLGQEIGTGRLKYRIMAKLGYGAFSTVWLVRPVGMSSRRGGWQALKIMEANSGSASQEVKSVQAVKNCGVDVAGCLDKNDTWREVRGHNTYLCLTMPLSGPTVDEVVECRPTLEQRLLLAFHATELMTKLHRGRIFINDFTSSNLLVKVRKDLMDFTEKDMMSMIKNEAGDVKQQIIDGDGRRRWVTPTDPIPDTLYAKVSLIPLIDERFQLEIIDVHQDASKNAITPSYASPETIKSQTVDEQSNIWSLGVLLCRILTGYYPFDYNSFEGVVDAQKEFFAMGPEDQRQKFNWWIENAFDSTGQPIFESYRQDRLADLLLSIFHRQVGLSSIKEMLKYIKHGAPKRADSGLEHDFSSMRISSQDSKKAVKKDISGTQSKQTSRKSKPSKSSAETVSSTSQQYTIAAPKHRDPSYKTTKPEPRSSRSRTDGTEEKRRHHSRSQTQQPAG